MELIFHQRSPNSNRIIHVGLGILDATVNSNEPDSQFLYWRGQRQWVRELAKNTLLVLGADIQLSPSNLVSLERYGLMASGKLVLSQQAHGVTSKLNGRYSNYFRQ